MKEVRVILSLEARKVYEYINKESKSSKIERTILKAINQKTELVKSNPHYGNPISKKIIPEIYRRKYGVNNLFRVELPNFWRMLYTLTEGETKVEIIAFVLDIVNHKNYNKKFGYK